MAPFWDPDARGALVGLATGHGRGALLARDDGGQALDGRWASARRSGDGEPVTSLVTTGGGAKRG